MKLLKRNLQTVYYSRYKSKSIEYESQSVGAYETGENDVQYYDPVAIQCSVSPARGYVQTEMFGNLDSYDRVIITDDMNCPIDEQSVLYVDVVPEYETVPTQDPEVTTQVCLFNYDYIVRRVAKSLNFIAIAISKVDVS